MARYFDEGLGFEPFELELGVGVGVDVDIDIEVGASVWVADSSEVNPPSVSSGKGICVNRSSS